jgi:hypothetical protein
MAMTFPRQTARRHSILPLRFVPTVAALGACLTGCFSMTPARSTPRIQRGIINSVTRIVGGMGSFRLATFDDDLGWGRGRSVHIGAGSWLGGGLRFMDFDLDRPSGDRYHVETVMGYFGAAVVRGHPYGWGGYYGVGLGSADIKGSGARGDDFAFSLSAGLVGYANTRDFAVGLVTEVGLFLAEPGGVNLDGVTFTSGIYISY